EEAREREDERHRATRGGEVPLQRRDEGTERVSATKAHEGDGKGGRDDEPAIEDGSRHRPRQPFVPLHDFRQHISGPGSAATDAVSCALVAVAVFTALRLPEQVAKFGQSALGMGLSRTEVVEAIIQTAPATG